MPQLRLFPPPGGLGTPLPEEVRSKARELLAELLAVVLGEIVARQPTHIGERNEQDSTEPFGTAGLHLRTAIEDGSSDSQPGERAATIRTG